MLHRLRYYFSTTKLLKIVELFAKNGHMCTLYMYEYRVRVSTLCYFLLCYISKMLMDTDVFAINA